MCPKNPKLDSKIYSDWTAPRAPGAIEKPFMTCESWTLNLLIRDVRKIEIVVFFLLDTKGLGV